MYIAVYSISLEGRAWPVSWERTRPRLVLPLETSQKPVRTDAGVQTGRTGADWNFPSAPCGGEADCSVTHPGWAPVKWWRGCEGAGAGISASQGEISSPILLQKTGEMLTSSRYWEAFVFFANTRFYTYDLSVKRRGSWSNHTIVIDIKKRCCGWFCLTGLSK